MALFGPEARKFPTFSNVVGLRSAKNRQVLKKSGDVSDRENEEPGERFDEKAERLKSDLPAPDSQHPRRFPPMVSVAGINADQFPAAERLETFHPGVSQGQGDRGRRTVFAGLTAVAHFGAEIKKGQHERDGAGAVKSKNNGRRGAKQLNGFLDQSQRCPVGFHEIRPSACPLAEMLEIAEVMEIRRDQNKKPSDEVKEGPGDRQSTEHPEGGHQPTGGPVGRNARTGRPPKAVGA